MDWRLPLSVRSDRHCKDAQTLNLSSANLGAVASFYVVGAVTGALGFGWITDRVRASPRLLRDADCLSYRGIAERLGLGLPGVSPSFGWSPVWASAANMLRSNSAMERTHSRRNIADGLT